MQKQSIIAFVMLLLQCCATARVQTKPSPESQELAQYKAKIMSADYRGDLDTLGQLRDELAKWPESRELSYLAAYWTGFASWRIAINGANKNMPQSEQELHLRKAAFEFYDAIKLKSDFADAYAAAALINSMFARYLYTVKDPDLNAVRERAALSYALLKRAEEIDPKNPCALWAKGGFALYRPPQTQEGVVRALAIYQEMLAEAQRRGTNPNSPLPDWGEPEARMSIAWTHMMTTPADLEKARGEAEAALAAVPEWSYVRDILLPQIRRQQSQ